MTCKNKNATDAVLSLHAISPKRDDPAAFWLLWSTYEAELKQHCLHWMAGNHTDAEDALSVAMFKARDKLPTYADTIVNPKAWLMQVTHNVCRDLHRTHQRERERHIDIDSIDTDDAQNSALWVEETPESIALDNEVAALLAHTISTLPPRLKTPLILNFYEDNSCLNIAQQLNLPVGTIYKRIQQAKEILQTTLPHVSTHPAPSKTAIPVVNPPEEAVPDNVEITPETLYELTSLCLMTLSPPLAPRCAQTQTNWLTDAQHPDVRPVDTDSSCVNAKPPSACEHTNALLVEEDEEDLHTVHQYREGLCCHTEIDANTLYEWTNLYVINLSQRLSVALDSPMQTDLFTTRQAEDALPAHPEISDDTLYTWTSICLTPLSSAAAVAFVPQTRPDLPAVSQSAPTLLTRPNLLTMNTAVSDACQQKCVLPLNAAMDLAAFYERTD